MINSVRIIPTFPSSNTGTPKQVFMDGLRIRAKYTQVQDPVITRDFCDKKSWFCYVFRS